MLGKIALQKPEKRDKHISGNREDGTAPPLPKVIDVKKRMSGRRQRVEVENLCTQPMIADWTGTQYTSKR